MVKLFALAGTVQLDACCGGQRNRLKLTGRRYSSVRGTVTLPGRNNCNVEVLMVYQLAAREQSMFQKTEAEMKKMVTSLIEFQWRREEVNSCVRTCDSTANALANASNRRDCIVCTKH